MTNLSFAVHNEFIPGLFNDGWLTFGGSDPLTAARHGHWLSPSWTLRTRGFSLASSGGGLSRNRSAGPVDTVLVVRCQFWFA